MDRDIVEQRILEEWSRTPEGSLVSGWAALRLYGGNFFDGRDDLDLMRERPVPVVLPPNAGFRPSTIEPHREIVPASERAVRQGIPCTIPARALFDAMKWVRDLRGRVITADMALSAGLVTGGAMRVYLASRSTAKGSYAVWEALELAEDRSRSPRESAMRLIWILDARLPRPKCNWPVADLRGRRVGKPDLLSEVLGVIGEYDGADHREADRHAEDVGKEDAYRNLGLECFRVVGRDIQDVGLVVRRMGSAVERARDAARPQSWSLRKNPGPL